jgi:hypothetical protein
LAATLIDACPAGSTVAVKFTTTEEVFKRCPRGTVCVVCDIDVPYRIVTEDAILDEPGTDTERLKRAGATRVIWAIARHSAVTQAWAAVGRMIGGASHVVMEGTTIVDLARPDLQLFVVHPFLSPARWKPLRAGFLAKADVVVNRPSNERRAPSRAVLDQLRALGAGSRLRVADVTRPLEEWAADLRERLRGHEGQPSDGASEPLPLSSF